MLLPPMVARKLLLLAEGSCAVGVGAAVVDRVGVEWAPVVVRRNNALAEGDGLP